MLTVSNGREALDFYQEGFGAKVVSRFDSPDGALVLAELAIDEARFFLSEETPKLANISPGTAGGTTVRLELTIADPDAFEKKAAAHGARIIFPVQDHDYGWRQGRVADPFGHQWVIGKPLM